MTNEILFSQHGLSRLKTGVDKLADAVKSTLGAKGRNVIIERLNDTPHITKDGVTVAKSITLADSVENMGASLIKEVAGKTADTAGDGTTTATVLAQSIITAGLKSLSVGANPMDLKRGIDKAVKVITDEIIKLSVPVKDNNTIQQIATISANNDAVIGKLIAKAFEVAGMDGIITVEQSKTNETNITIVEGLQFERGYISPFFVNDPAKEICELDKPVIILFDDRLQIMRDFLPLLQKAVEKQRPVFIICEELEGEALATLVVNKMRGQLNIAAVKAPYFGVNRKMAMEDIAVLTGGTYISETKGMKLDGFGAEHFNESVFGSCEKVVIEKDKTTIIGGHGTQIKERCDELKEQIANSENEHDKEFLKTRLAKLTNGVAVINVGAATETEIKEKKDRIDDALHATRAAAEEGFIAGGGVTYIKTIEALKVCKTENEDEATGVMIVRKALEEPFRQILSNAGIEAGGIIRDVRKKPYGWGMNVKTDNFENLLESGIIDPAKVSRIALENAASIASLLLTTDCVVYLNKDEQLRQDSIQNN